MYDSPDTPIQKVTHRNIVETDIRGLGTGVGGFSNCATIIEAMRAIFTKESQEEQRRELVKRKKLLREIVGAEIDKIKGSAAPKLPSSWKKFVQVHPDDTDAVKAEKYKHNSMVISKKPYFFRYLYPELNRRFIQYESSYNIISKDMFGIRLKKLLSKKDKTEAEKTLVRRYQKFSPLIVSNCTMNILCREFENVDFDIKFKNNYVNLLPTFESEGFELDKDILISMRTAYRKYNNKKAVRFLESIFEDIQEDDIREIRFHAMDTVKEEIKSEVFGLQLTIKEYLFYIGQLAKNYKKFNWGFAWDILEDFIIEQIPQGRTFAPVRDEEGKEYLGSLYSLLEIVREVEEVKDSGAILCDSGTSGTDITE